MKEVLKILLVEDNYLDVELIQRCLKKSDIDFEFLQVQERDEYLDALDVFEPSIILSDYNLPDFNGFEALTLLRDRNSITPFIFVSGAMGEEMAVRSLQQGAYDYILKDRLQRLPHAIEKAISDKKNQEVFLKAQDDLKESEIRYRSIIEASSDWIWEIDTSGNFLYISDHVKEKLGYSPLELKGRPFYNLIFEDDRQGIIEEFLRCVTGICEIVDLETHCMTKDGQDVFFLMHGVPVISPSGDFTGYRGFNKDITEKKRYYDEKRAIELQLQQAQKLETLGRLAGGVAHDYNNALSVIMGFTELALMDTSENNPIYTHLNHILDATNHATEITKQLLTFARKEIIKPQIIDMNTIIEKMLKILKQLIGEEITLNWSPETDLWPILMDPSQVNQILANLCVNARDAIDGVGEILIETKMQTLCDNMGAASRIPDGEYVMLRISDTGQGMSKDILNKIFEPFFTTKGQNKGTGLGMAMVHGIVEQNNGYIDIFSKIGQGTSISVYLPKQVKDVESQESESGETISAGAGECILLVEDNTAILNLTKTILTGLGYCVVTAGLPSEAIEIVEKGMVDFQLIITDVIMPEMSGKDLCDKLRSLRPGLKNLYMSGYTANILSPHGVLDEGTYFIQKPFTRFGLSTIVKKVLNS